MNKITEKIWVGTVGELLVSLKLLQYGVQAAPPLKDSGNDLIAIHRESLQAIQVKTIRKGTFNNSSLWKKLFHLVAYVFLVEEKGEFNLKETRVFLMHRDELNEIKKSTFSVEELEAYELSRDRVNWLFGINPDLEEIVFISEDEEKDEEEPRVAVEVPRASEN